MDIVENIFLTALRLTLRVLQFVFITIPLEIIGFIGRRK